MAAHRYWRLKVNTYHGAQVRLATLALFNPSGTNIATTGNGTAAASVADQGDAANAFDASAATLWGTSVPSAGMWLRWDFGAGNEQDIVKIAITNSNFTTYSVNACELQHSDDGTTFTTLINVTNPTTNDAVTTTYVPGVVVATLALPLPMAASSGGAFVALSLPALTARLEAGANNVLINLPTPLAVTGTGHDSTGEQAAQIMLPGLALAASAGATAGLALPGLQAQSSGTVTGFASAELALPSLSVVGAVTVSGTGQADITLPAMAATGYAGALCSITMGAVTLQATGTTGAIGRAQLTLPLLEAVAIATAQNHGSAALSLPMPILGGANQALLELPGLSLTAIGSAVVTASYEAYAVNLKHSGNPAPVDEVTRYSNFPFTHVVRYQKSYYGVNSTGLYLLEGSTDNAAPIPWSFKTAITDFGTAKDKTVSAAYFGGSLGTAATVELHVGAATYAHAFVGTTDRTKTHRQKLGRGSKGRYFALGAAGNGPLTLDDIEFVNETLTRRI